MPISIFSCVFAENCVTLIFMKPQGFLVWIRCCFFQLSANFAFAFDCVAIDYYRFSLSLNKFHTYYLKPQKKCCVINCECVTWIVNRLNEQIFVPSLNNFAGWNCCGFCIV
jgi:hypothetical protein